MKTITENENNKNKAVVTTASSDWVIPVRNPTTGEECNIPLANLSSVVAELLPVKLRFREFKNVLASTEVGITWTYAGIYMVSCPDTGFSTVFVNGSQTFSDDTIFFKSSPNAKFTIEPDRPSAIAIYKKEINGEIFFKNNYNYPVNIRFTSLCYF